MLVGAGWFIMASSSMAGMTETSLHMAIRKFLGQQGRDPSMCNHFQTLLMS